MLRSFPARTSSHNSRSRHGSASFGQQRSYTGTLQNMPSSFPFALRPGEPKSTHAMMTSLLSRREKQLWFTWETVVNAKTDQRLRNKGKRHSEWKVAECPRRHRSHPGWHPAPAVNRRRNYVGRSRSYVKEASNCLSCHIAAKGPTAGAFFSWRAARATRRFRGSK
jgi:hypothetical protein